MENRSIEQSYDINAPQEEVWKSLTDPEYIEQWGGGPAIMDDRIGTNFKLWGGDIYGRNIEIIHAKELKQEWFGGKNWKEPSIVTFTLTALDEEITRLKLTHDNIPAEKAEEFAQGWTNYYLEPIKNFLENKLSI